MNSRFDIDICGSNRLLRTINADLAGAYEYARINYNPQKILITSQLAFIFLDAHTLRALNIDLPRKVLNKLSIQALSDIGKYQQ
jgi:hypothetical protein